MCARETSQQNKPAPVNIASGLENLNIFYIDDEENNIHALSTLMDNWGCRLASATRFTSALEYAENHQPPDVILMDYQLDTGSNGIQLAQELRKSWPQVPVCIVSAAPDENLSTRVSTQGFDFLRKPIKPGKLRALLERYSQRKKA